MLPSESCYRPIAADAEIKQTVRNFPADEASMSGVFVKRGMTFAIPAGGFSLSIGDDGKPSGNLTIHVHYDVCPTWLELASRHLSDAEERKRTRIAAWNADDQDARAASMEAEFKSSMQAIMAAAIAIIPFMPH